MRRQALSTIAARARHAGRLAGLGLLLAGFALVVPDSGPASTQAVLVKFERADGVALES